MHQLAREKPAILVLSAAVLYSCVLSAVTIGTYVTYATGWDHAIFTQYVWLLAQGSSPLNTLNGRFLLGDHVEPGLALLAPLGLLGGTAASLLVLQSIALALVAPILYVLGRRAGVDPWLSAVVPLLWLVSPAVVRPNLWEFHPETIAAPLVAASALAALLERWRWFVALAILACTFREDVALLYIGGGIVLYLHGRRVGGLVLSACATLWYTISVLVVLPAFGTAVEEDFGPRFAGGRGDSLSDVFRFAFANPLQFLNETFDVGKLGILAVLVLTTAGLCCLVPRWIVVPLPILVLNFVSDYDNQHSLRFQYYVLPAVAVAVAGVMGARVLMQLGVGRRSLMRFAVVTAVILASMSLAEIRFASNVAWSSRDARADRQAVVSAVPPGAVVAASTSLAPHLARRREVYALPEPFSAVLLGTRWDASDRSERASVVDYIALDAASFHWDMGNDSIEALVRSSGFRPVLRRGAVTLFVRR